MTPSRQLRIAQWTLAFAFVGLGVWGLAKAEYGMGAFWLVIGVLWLGIAAFGDRLRAARAGTPADDVARR